MIRATLTEANAADLARDAAQVIRHGGLVIHPTDTVYGIGADATNADAVARTARIKGRGPGMQFIVLLSGLEALREWASFSNGETERVVERCATSAVTCIVHSSARAQREIAGCGSTLAVRIPSHAFTAQLCSNAAGPLLSTSANLHGGATPHSPDEMPVALIEGVDLVVDGGRLPGVASTILDATTWPPKIIRVGSVSSDTLQTLIRSAVMPA